MQHYSWGGYAFIPELLGIKNEEKRPYAEYWLGAHPAQSSRSGDYPLSLLLGENPALLGPAVQQRFGGLPFLLKVLDVRQMLSIQVHPAKAAAEEGYAEEEARGIDRKAAHRNYKDSNHKPELMVALGEFWLLHGFKPRQALLETLEAVPGFAFFADILDREGYEALYAAAMQLPQERVDALLQPVADRILPLYRNGELEKRGEDFWAARAMETYGRSGRFDRGIFSIYFFNLLQLQKGDGIFQGAGLPHAYLEGRNIEIMANSDNVLRGGLTDKHVAVDELMKHVQFVATDPQIIAFDREAHQVYPSPAAEFELHRYETNGYTELLTTAGPEIWLVMEGRVSVRSEGTEHTLDRGESIFLGAGAEVFFSSGTPTQLFRAMVG